MFKYISKLILVLPCILMYSSYTAAQDIIQLNNPSFEDRPHAGGQGIVGIKDWYDCGRINFPAESPPDIHPGGFWKNEILPNDGDTYLGMVTRDNETWESVSQRMNSPLQAGKCYEFSIDLAKSDTYISNSRVNTNDTNYVRPTVLRIWGGAGPCTENQLLAESPPINHQDWRTYNFEFNPSFRVGSITLEVFYKTPVLDPYNGHLLIDNASDINMVPCPGEEIIAEAEGPQKKENILPPHKRRKQKPKPKEEPKKEVVAAKPKEKILKDLDRKKIYKGQKINIDNLYFAADASEISEKSYDVLDEVVDFLAQNQDVKIEIGGHTNGTPKHNYCDSLSRARAKEVAEYINKKGIKANRLQFKGYGKRKPIASNNTKEGRKKNQRVEIKILSLDS